MLKYVAGLLGLAAVVASNAGRAQPADNPLPKGPISIVVPLAPGGPADVIARVLASKMSARIGRTVIVDNKAGAGGNIGAAYVAHAPADGSTWLYTVDSVLTTNPWMYASQGFDPAKDLIPVARVEDVLLMLAVNAKSIPARSWPELVELSKTRPLAFGSAGVGSPGHLALEYLKSVSPIQASHVPYRGAALAMQDLLSGQIDATFIVAGVLVPHVKSGALRALAVSANARIDALPDVPSAAEAGITGFEARFSNLLLAPAGTPKPVRDFMAAQIAPILSDPEVRGKFDVMAETPTERHDEQDATAWVTQERERWGRVIKSAGIKAE